MRLFNYLILSCVFMLCSCEKVDLSDYLNNSDGGYSVVFNMGIMTQSDFDTRTTKNIGEICSVINFAVFQDGTKIKTINQKRGDASFGVIKLSLAEGDYDIVAVAHNGSGNASLTDVQKITFTNNKITDTFSVHSKISVNSSKDVDLQMQRVVAMFRLQIDQEIPADVKQLKFYYTGGSSTLDATTGFGCVNSRQTEIRDVKTHEAGQVFEVYTFPHDVNGVLNMTITALDSSGSDYQVKTLPEVYVTINKITTYYGNFFASSLENSNNGFCLFGDDQWAGEDKIQL